MKYFHDEALQAAFDRDGYVLVDLLDLPTVDALSSFYWDNTKQHLPGFNTTGIHADVAYRQKVSDFVQAQMMPHINRYLIDFKPLICSFLIKEAQSASTVGPHQDWSFVDESKSVSFNIWCPLVDTNEENGRLYVVPGTHKLPRFPRTAPSSYYPYQDFDGLLQAKAVPISTRRGQAIIYDNCMVHFSPPNQSAEHRLVAGVLAIPQDAKPVLYFNQQANSPGTARMYQLPDDHYIQNQIFVEPDQQFFVREVPIPLQTNAENDLKKALGIDIAKPSFWTRLWQKFS